MSLSARVLLLNADQTSAMLADKIRSQGYDPIIAGDGDPFAMVSETQPDLVVIDAENGARDGWSVTSRLKTDPATDTIPVILVNDDISGPAQARAFEAGADDLVRLPMSDASLFARIRSLVRLRTMHTELMRRRDTLDRFGIEVPPESIGALDLAGTRVLVVGSGEDDVIATLKDAYWLDVESDPDAAMGRMIAEHYHAVVVMAGPGQGDDMIAFCADVRGNMSLFNTPLILVLSDGGVEEAETAFGHLVNDVLFQPLAADELHQRVLAWVRQQHYRVSLLQSARDAQHILTLDGLTGAYTHGFMLDYLTSLMADCEAHGQSFALGHIEVAGLERINRENGYSAGDYLLRQIGQLLVQLVRAEDLPARYRGKEFCIVLPRTAAADARQVLNRIVGIIQSTEFLVIGGMTVVEVKLVSGISEFHKGDTVRRMLERAQRVAE